MSRDHLCGLAEPEIGISLGQHAHPVLLTVDEVLQCEICCMGIGSQAEEDYA